MTARTSLRPKHVARPGFEPLEGRHLLASFLVTNAEDSGAGSLRQAITDAGTTAGPSTVAFDIPGGGVHTIALASSLPTIHVPLAIDATTQPGYSGTPLVALDGSNAGPFATGLDFVNFTGGAGSVRGLVIENFGGVGIAAFGNGVTIQSNTIGVDPSGQVAVGKQAGGVVLSGQGATVGGTTAAEGNVISGNGSFGIELLGTSNALVSHNLIGTDPSGQANLGNGTDGISIGLGSTATTVSSNIIANSGRLAIDDRGTGTVLADNVTTNSGTQVADVAVVASDTMIATATGRIEQILYTFTNRGPHEATDVHFRLVSRNFLTNFDLALPPPVFQFAGAIASQGTISPNVGFNDFSSTDLAQLGTIAPGASAAVLVAISIVGPGSDSLDASATGTQPTLATDLAASTAIVAVGTADLAVMALPTPAVAEVGVPLAIQFLVTNRDPRFAIPAQDALDLTGLDGASIISVTTSPGRIAPLPGRTDFYAGDVNTPNPIVPSGTPSGLAPGQSAVVTVTLVPTRPGPIRLSLAASSAVNIDPDPSNNLALAGTVAERALTVTRVVLLPMTGPITSVRLTFDAPLVRSQAQDLRNYRLTTNGARVAVRSATYDAKAHTVTLRLARSLSRAGAPLALVVGGPGTPGLSGADGSKLLGGSYSATINRG